MLGKKAFNLIRVVVNVQTLCSRSAFTASKLSFLQAALNIIGCDKNESLCEEAGRKESESRHRYLELENGVVHTFVEVFWGWQLRM